MKKLLLLICALLGLGTSGAWADVTTPSFSNVAATSLNTGWYQIKWVSANGATTTYTDSELDGKYVTNYATDVTVSEKDYALYLGSAPSNANEHAFTFVYFNRTGELSGSGKYGNLQSANGRYIQIDGSSSLIAPETKSAIVVVSGGKPESTITSGGQYDSNRYGLIPLGKDDTPYIGQTGNKQYPKVLISSVNLAGLGLTAWHVTINGLNESLASSNTQITYAGSGVYGLTKVYNNGTFFIDSSVTPTESDLSVPSKTGFTANVTIDNSAKTITVDYTATYTFTLTDVNGAEYTGTINDGILGVTPTITGCDGLSIESEVWDYEKKTYAANIVFPFTVSSNSKTNYTYIGSFHNKADYGNNGKSSADFIWHANGTSVIVHSKDEPDNTYDEETEKYTEQEKYEWAIEPVWESANRKFTFKIKNASTGTYIYSTYTGTNDNGHNVGVVTLNATATSLTYKNYTGSNYSWYIVREPASDSRYLSVNSISGGVGQVLGVFSSTHDGVSVGFYTPADFSALSTTLNGLRTEAAKRTFGSGLGKYNAENATEINAKLTELTTKTVFTASEYNADIALLSDIQINVPATNAFYRIKGYSNNYITSNTAGSNASMNGTSSANNIIFYNADNNLIFFGSGYGLYDTHTVAPVGSTLNAYTFLEGAQIGKYYLKSNYSGSTYCYDNTASGTKLDRNGSPVTSGSYQTDWSIEEVTSLPVTISSVGYATLYSPVALTIPTGITAYVAAEDVVDRLRMTPISDGIIPANCGVVLKGAEGSYNFDITTGGTATSLLKGDIATITKPANAYYLSNGSEGIGFYKAGEGVTTLAGFKAYYEAAGVGVKQFIFEDADGIKVMENGQWTMDNANIFNLAGQRMNKLQRGVNIVNGKKIIVK